MKYRSQTVMILLCDILHCYSLLIAYDFKKVNTFKEKKIWNSRIRIEIYMEKSQTEKKII